MSNRTTYRRQIELHTDVKEISTGLQLCIMAVEKKRLLWVGEKLVEGGAPFFKCSAHLEKEDCVILADGELNQGGALPVRCVLHVDADDLLAACLQNFLVVLDVPVDGVHVVGVDHRQHRLTVRLDIFEDLGERHGWKEEEQCEGSVGVCGIIKRWCGEFKGER